MSIRFNLGTQRPPLDAIAKWMNKHIGMIEEGETWFWSIEIYKEYCELSKQMVERHREGIRIWKDCSAVSLAIIKWG